MFQQFKLQIYLGLAVALLAALGFGSYQLYQAGYKAATGDMATDVVRIQNAAIADARKKSEAAASRVAQLEQEFQASLSRETELRNALANLPDSGARFSNDELLVLDRIRRSSRTPSTR